MHWLAEPLHTKGGGMSTYKPWADEIAVERGQGSRTAREDRHLYAVREIADSEWIGVVGGEAPGGADGWAQLFQAAPKMVHALCVLLGDGPRKHLSTCHALRREGAPCHPECAAVREAIIAAGVPL